MRNSRLSHDDVTAILDGAAPLGRPDLEQLAMIVDDLRLGSLESTPRPSAELAALFDGISGISPYAGGLRRESDRGAVPAKLALVPHRGRTQMALSWFAGLGLAAKIGIGATAVALGATGAGAAHALPPSIQTGFDEIVASVTPDSGDAGEDEGSDDDDVVDGTTGVLSDDGAADDSATDDGEVEDSGDDSADDKTEHAQGVTEAAHDESTEGREHGEDVSDAAHQNRGGDDSSDDAAELEDESDDDESDDSDSDDSDSDDSDSEDSDSSNSGSDDSGPGSTKHDR